MGMVQLKPNRTVKTWFNGLLVPKNINSLVWFGFSINSLVSVWFGSKTRVYRFGLKVYRLTFVLP